MAQSCEASVDIFVVDDDRVIGQTLGIILRLAGYGVSVFEDAFNALQCLHTGPRLLISDHQMPGLSGCELAGLVLRNTPAVKMLLISASLTLSDLEWQAVQKSSGDAKLMAKPLAPDRLLKCVQEMIGPPSIT